MWQQCKKSHGTLGFQRLFKWLDLMQERTWCFGIALLSLKFVSIMLNQRMFPLVKFISYLFIISNTGHCSIGIKGIASFALIKYYLICLLMLKLGVPLWQQLKFIASIYYMKKGIAQLALIKCYCICLLFLKKGFAPLALITCYFIC